MYKLWREILAEKTRDWRAFKDRQRLKTKGLFKFANTYMEPIHHNIALFKVYVDVLILVTVYTATIQTHDQYLRSIHL